MFRVILDMDDLKRKKTNLKKTQGKVKLHERKLAVLKKQTTILQKREHLKKIYAAGQIIKNARRQLLSV